MAQGCEGSVEFPRDFLVLAAQPHVSALPADQDRIDVHTFIHVPVPLSIHLSIHYLQAPFRCYLPPSPAYASQPATSCDLPSVCSSLMSLDASSSSNSFWPAFRSLERGLYTCQEIIYNITSRTTYACKTTYTDMYVYVYVRICMCTCVCTCMCMYTYEIYICICVSMYMFVDFLLSVTGLPTKARVVLIIQHESYTVGSRTKVKCVCIHIHIYLCTCMQFYIQTYPYVYIYIHIVYEHVTCMYTCSRSC